MNLYLYYNNYFSRQLFVLKCLKLKNRYFTIYFDLILLTIASINIAVKNRLNEGINTGYQSFWNKIYISELPFTLKVKLIPRKIAPIIKI